MKAFKHWKRQQVQETFGLKKFETLPILERWLTVDTTKITAEERKDVEKLRVLLKRHVLDWNEAELKFHFLGPFMLAIDFYSDHYNPFVERPLTVKLGEDTAVGIVDFLVAAGEQIPKAPYFCLHEYKPEEGSSNDPFGQLLIAMVAAQQANEAEGKIFPIYGAFVIGRNFYFVVLDSKDFAVSDIYAATQDDIYEVFAIFRKVRSYIDALLENVG